MSDVRAKVHCCALAQTRHNQVTQPVKFDFCTPVPNLSRFIDYLSLNMSTYVVDVWHGNVLVHMV